MLVESRGYYIYISIKHNFSVLQGYLCMQTVAAAGATVRYNRKN